MRYVGHIGMDFQEAGGGMQGNKVRHSEIKYRKWCPLIYYNGTGILLIVLWGQK